MVSLGIRALKAHLSYHVRLAQAGTRVVITDRGKPVAVLGPIYEQAPPWVRAFVAQGRGTWSGGKPAGLRTRIPARGRLASREIIEDRR